MVVRSFEHIVSTFGFTFVNLNYSPFLQIEILGLQKSIHAKAEQLVINACFNRSYPNRLFLWWRNFIKDAEVRTVDRDR